MSSPRSIGRTATSPANAQHHGWGKQTQNNSKPYFSLLISTSWSSLWRERGPFEGIDCWFAVSSTLACGYCKFSIFRRQGHLFPLAGGQQDPKFYCSLSQTVHLLVTLVVIGERLLLQSILKQQRNWSRVPVAITWFATFIGWRQWRREGKCLGIETGMG